MQHLPRLTGHVAHTILASLLTAQGGIQYVFYLKFLFFANDTHKKERKRKNQNLIPLLSIEIHKISLSRLLNLPLDFCSYFHFSSPPYCQMLLVRGQRPDNIYLIHRQVYVLIAVAIAVKFVFYFLGVRIEFYFLFFLLKWTNHISIKLNSSSPRCYSVYIF